MIRNWIRRFLNKRNYEIIKQDYLGDLYPNVSQEIDIYHCVTPVGEYYLPIDVENDPVTNTIARGRYFEPNIIEVAKKYIKVDSTVIDIGANFGQMSIEFSKFVGNSGKVISFEAQNFVYKCLEKNIKANNCSNIDIYSRAVYNKSDLTFYFKNLEKNNTYSMNGVTKEINNSLPVQTVTIDSLKIETPISFIKVDIQGADLFALQGAINTIKKYKPAIIFEYEEQFQETFGTKFQDYVDFVSEINYRFEKTIDGINYLLLPND